MIKTFFISDTHFGHTNILKHEPSRKELLSQKEKVHKSIGVNFIQKGEFFEIHGSGLGVKEEIFMIEENETSALIKQHDEELVRRWNSVVRNKDIVYHLGDFCFGRDNIKIAERLNGQKRLVMGNHDCYPVEEYLKYFDKVHGVLYIKGDLVLSHIPLHPENTKRCVNIHGHLHSKKTYSDRYFCVSCEQINFTPISLDDIFKLIRGNGIVDCYDGLEVV